MSEITTDGSYSISDSQLAHGDEYAYSQASFAEFHDLMVASLPPEFEVGLDVEVYAKELEKIGPDTVAVDLATGSGRVLEALAKVKSCKTLVGIDNAQAMLDACKKRSITFDKDAPDVQLVHQSMQTLCLPHLDGQCHAVFMSAGSFHHLTSRAEQMATLRNIRTLLMPRSKSRAAISLLKAEECINAEEDANDVVKVGRFERKLVSKDIEHVKEPATPGGEIYDSDIVTTAYECRDTSTGAIQRQMWSLRTVSDAEFVALCGECGFQVDAKYSKFANVAKGMQATANEEPVLYFLSPLRS